MKPRHKIYNWNNNFLNIFESAIIKMMWIKYMEETSFFEFLHNLKMVILLLYADIADSIFEVFDISEE